MVNRKSIYIVTTTHPKEKFRRVYKQFFGKLIMTTVKEENKDAECEIRSTAKLNRCRLPCLQFVFQIGLHIDMGKAKKAKGSNKAAVKASKKEKQAKKVEQKSKKQLALEAAADEEDLLTTLEEFRALSGLASYILV
jgi:hypothetical protein